MAILTKSHRNFSTAIMTGQRSWLLWVLMIAGLIAYVLPWIASPGTALTLNAYDLAEWSSLAPGARDTTPALLTSLLLRLPLLSIAFLMESYTTNWKSVPLVICFAGALLPPFEFFAHASGDPNYRQQFALAMVALLGGLALQSNILRQFGRILKMGLLLMGIVGGVWGLAQSYHLMLQFSLPAKLGIGGVLFVVSYLFLMILAFVPDSKTR